MKTKRDAILAHLKRLRFITPAQAYRLYDAMRLASDIHVLRNQGHLIKTHIIQVGKTIHAKYEYMGKAGER